MIGTGVVVAEPALISELKMRERLSDFKGFYSGIPEKIIFFSLTLKREKFEAIIEIYSQYFVWDYAVFFLRKSCLVDKSFFDEQCMHADRVGLIEGRREAGLLDVSVTELQELVANLAKSQAETHRQLKETDSQIKEPGRQIGGL